MKVWINLNGNKRKRTFTPSLGITLYGVRERQNKSQNGNSWETIEESNILKWWSGFNRTRREKECLEKLKIIHNFTDNRTLVPESMCVQAVRTGSGEVKGGWRAIRELCEIISDQRVSRAKWRYNKDNHVCLEGFGLLGMTIIRIMHNKNYAQHEDTDLDRLSGNRQYSVLILIFLKLSLGHLSWWKHSLGSLGGAVSGYQECLFVFLNRGVDMVMTSERPMTQGSQC